MVKSRDDLAILNPQTAKLGTTGGRLIRTARPVPYPIAMETMDTIAQEVRDGGEDVFWFLEHPAMLTAGTSAKIQDLCQPERFEIHNTGRGGQYTYHGPGQRIVYAVVDLRKRGNDVRRHVASLEQAIISTMGSFNISAHRAEDRVGVWVPRPEKAPLQNGSIREDKIAAIGIRVSRGVAFHGFAVNFDPDLSHYDSIVPCGVVGHGITSLIDLGLPITMEDLDIALAKGLAEQFGADTELTEV